MDIPKEVKWYGNKEPLPESKTFNAGAILVDYSAGSLRNIRVGNHEVIRMIYIALRDHNWGTILPEMRNEQIHMEKDGFQVKYENHYRKGDINFRCLVSITGTKNQLVFEISGEAFFEFRTNRTGFCVLHPVRENAGKSCKVISPGGKTQNCTFPKLISPNQPMKDIAELVWMVDDGLEAHLDFEGDVFEMEDQRNWTDDSYKTYCRPLELPFPYRLKKGDKINQRITFSISGDAKPQTTGNAGYELTYDQNSSFPLPIIGIGQPESAPSLVDSEVDLIRKSGFDYYDITVLFEDSWISELENAIEEAKVLNLKVFLKVYFSSNYLIEIRQLSSILAKHQNVVDSILVLELKKLVTSDGFIYKVADPLRSAFPSIKIGAGTAGFFTALNRNLIKSPDPDFLSYSLNPQVHAYDHLTLIENLNGQSDTILSAKAIAGKKEVHIRPVTFKMQLNPAATTNETDTSKQVDVRQMSLFGAGWTLGSIKHMAESGVSAVTYFETIGEKGIIQGESSPKNPEIFQVEKGAVFPMYYVFHEILKKKEGVVISSVSSHPNDFEGMVLEENGKKTFLLANYTNRQIEVRVDGISPKAKVSKLDEKSLLRAMYNHDEYMHSPHCDFKFEEPVTTIKMRPYAFVIVNE